MLPGRWPFPHLPRALARRWPRAARRGVTGAVALLLAAPGALAGPGDRRPPGSPVVVDGAGRVVGTVEGAAAPFLFAAVAISAGGAPRLVYVGREQFVASTGQVAFESSACLGDRFLLIPSPGSAGFYAHAAIGPGNVLHGPTGSLESRTIRSVWFPLQSPACQSVPPAPFDVFPVIDLLDLDVFEPPFRLE